MLTGLSFSKDFFFLTLHLLIVKEHPNMYRHVQSRELNIFTVVSSSFRLFSMGRLICYHLRRNYALFFQLLSFKSISLISFHARTHTGLFHFLKWLHEWWSISSKKDGFWNRTAWLWPFSKPLTPLCFRYLYNEHTDNTCCIRVFVCVCVCEHWMSQYI